MLDTPHAIRTAFDQAALAEALPAFSQAELDDLDFGVIGIDTDCTVRAYNRFESEAAGLSMGRVLGHHLFDVVAPCMNNFMVAQRFEEAQDRGVALDQTIDYVLTLRMRPVKVKLRLLAPAACDNRAALRYVLVQRKV